MRTSIFIAVSASFAALQACASTPGAHPSDMSVAQHEQAAGAAEAQAGTHAEQYGAGQTTKQCDNLVASCWTSNPTQAHQEDADKLRKMAADHRAAAQTLRDAEASFCSGLSNDDRDISPFSHRDDIASVRPAYEHVTGKQPVDRLVGAVVVFRAAQGMSAEWLQRVVDCHIARNNALGNEVPEMSYCPLVPKGVSARVSPAVGGFAVTISSSDSQTAQEVLRRATALNGGR